MTFFVHRVLPLRNLRREPARTQSGQARSRPSHHPLIACLSERRRVLWATLRAGQAGTANGVRGFLAQALALLPAKHRVALLRADAGFYETAFLEMLEARDLPSIIVARLTPLLRTVVIRRIPEADWWRVAPRD